MSALAPTAFEALAESGIEISSNIPIVGNAAICADSLCTTSRAGVNFYCCPSPISRFFFGASCLCGVMGAVSGTALVTSFTAIPAAGWFGSFGARAFNHAGKYTMHMGNVISGNITSVAEISELLD